MQTTKIVFMLTVLFCFNTLATASTPNMVPIIMYLLSDSEEEVDTTAPIFTSSTTASVYENQTDVITVAATDDNAVTYTLTSDDDGASFSIDSETGIVTFNEAPDYETKDTYTFTVTATDEAGNSTTQTITITVEDYFNPFLINKFTNDDGEYYGYAVAISDDYMVVGNEEDALVDIYKIQSDINITLIAQTEVPDSNYITSLAIDGQYFICGDRSNDLNASNAGAAFLYKIDTNDSVSQVATIFASDAEASDNFGTSVSISGNTIVIGSEYEDTNGSNAGAAYIYKIGSGDTVEEIQKVIASDVDSNDYFGSSVSISDEYIVIGARGKDVNSTNTGAAYLYKIDSNDTVTQIQQIIASDGSDNDYFGSAVSISDGYIAIGVEYEDSTASNAGAAYIYKIDSSDTVSQIQKLTASNGQRNAYFGSSIAISKNYIVVGAYGHDDVGSAYLFKIDANDSVSEVQELLSDTTLNSDAEYGHAVGIYGDNIIVSALYENLLFDEQGQIYLFDLEASDTTLYAYEDVPTHIDTDEGEVSLLHTFSLASISGSLSYEISGDDAEYFHMTDTNLSFINAPDYENKLDTNADNIYDISVDATDAKGNTRSFPISITVVDKIFTQEAQAFASDADAGDRFGTSVAISDEYMLVGAERESEFGSHAGAAYLYKINADKSLSELSKITASDAGSGDDFGISVAISDSYIVIGADMEDTNGTYAGAAYVYQIADDTVTQIAKITASDASSDSWFGRSVAISNKYIVVGAYRDDISISGSGSVYLFKISDDNTSVSEIQKITASDAEANDYFGQSVDISDTHIVVGAYQKNSLAGAAYVYTLNSDENVSEIQKITASDAEANDYFGYSVSLSNSYIVVGAYNEDTNGSNAGAAYVYKIADDNSSVEALDKITAPDAEATNYFGKSVSISSPYVVIGAYRADTSVSNGGKGYIYKIENDDSITTVESITASDTQINDAFSWSVSIYNDNIAIGAYAEDTKGSSAGTAYFFSYDYTD